MAARLYMYKNEAVDAQETYKLPIQQHHTLLTIQASRASFTFTGSSS
jgi:hypothetical protein